VESQLPGGGWSLERHAGTAQELHDLAPPSGRTVLVLQVDAPSLVLGSTQDEASVDHLALERAGVRLARRRSGGGAVLLVPGEHLWVDVVLPAEDPLWVDDVERSSWWLGEAWTAALHDVVTGPLEVHRSGVTDRLLGRTVCFAATGPGEVGAGRRKLVGVSQRRTRDHARFQCVVHRRFVAAATVDLLDPRHLPPGTEAALDRGVTDLDRLGVDAGWSAVEALLRHLP
jgi:lipoate-protein ligase A